MLSKQQVANKLFKECKTLEEMVIAAQSYGYKIESIRLEKGDGNLHVDNRQECSCPIETTKKQSTKGNVKNGSSSPRKPKNLNLKKKRSR